MMFRSFFPRDLFAEMDRLQREMQQSYDVFPSIRGVNPGTFPVMNVGRTPRSVEIFAFAPGIDAGRLDVQIEKGVLVVAGTRSQDTLPEKASVHVDERFAGDFRRVVALPEDVDPDAVSATYRDGVLHISIARKAAAQPRRITIQ